MERGGARELEQFHYLTALINCLACQSQKLAPILFASSFQFRRVSIYSQASASSQVVIVTLRIFIPPQLSPCTLIPITSREAATQLTNYHMRIVVPPTMMT